MKSSKYTHNTYTDTYIIKKKHGTWKHKYTHKIKYFDCKDTCPAAYDHNIKHTKLSSAKYL